LLSQSAKCNAILSIKVLVLLFPTQPAVHFPPLGNLEPLANDIVLTGKYVFSPKSEH
jgi:hypothetical protein